jgi:hypothetical protein
LHKIVFHKFNLGDVEDPELYAAVPLSKFMETDMGQWIKKNCADPQYIVRPDASSYGFQVLIYGEVQEQDAVFYQLKWGSHDRTLG